MASRIVIDDPGWYERECKELRICDEYLQQCEQTDLLPISGGSSSSAWTATASRWSRDGGMISAPATSLLRGRPRST
jgi:hypothetical protein